MDQLLPCKTNKQTKKKLALWRASEKYNNKKCRWGLDCSQKIWSPSYVLFKVFFVPPPPPPHPTVVSAPISSLHSAELSHKAAYTLCVACTEGRHTLTHVHTHVWVCENNWLMFYCTTTTSSSDQTHPQTRKKKQKQEERQTVRVLSKHQLHSSTRLWFKLDIFQPAGCWLRSE